MAIFTALVDDLRIVVTNQEALQEPLQINTKLDDGTVVPMDLTGLTFKSQVKSARDITGPVLININVEVQGDPTLGKVVLKADEAVMETMAIGNYFYDVNIKPTGGQPDCLWIAPFVVEAGVSKWP